MVVHPVSRNRLKSSRLPAGMGNGTTMEVITCGMTTEHSLPYMVFFVSVLIDFARKKEHTLERGDVDCWAFLCIGTCGAEAKRVCGIAQPYNLNRSI